MGDTLDRTNEGVETNIAVNVIAPLILTRMLVPALRAAEPTGNVQITSGGLPIDTINMKDLQGQNKSVGVSAYSHLKRVMECMSLALSRELMQDGISLNIVGGALPAATAMTSEMTLSSLPCYAK